MTNNTIRVAETQRDYADERRTETCTRCGGMGWYTESRPANHPWIEYVHRVDPCPTCRGDGVVSYGEARR